MGFRRFGQVPGLWVCWSLGPLVPWSLVPWSSGPWVLWVFDTLFRGLLEINPSCRQSVCKLGGRRPPQPPRFLSCTRPRQVSSCQQKTEPTWPLSEPVIKDIVCANGGGGAARDKDFVFAIGGLRPPPTPPPPLSLYAVQACVQEHRTISKTGFTRATVIELFKSHHACSVHLQMVGLRLPKPYGPFRDLWFASGGGGCAQSPPLSFLRRAGLLSKTIAPSTRLASRASLF